jgi:hypothetical protein
MSLNVARHWLSRSREAAWPLQPGKAAAENPARQGETASNFSRLHWFRRLTSVRRPTGACLWHQSQSLTQAAFPDSRHQSSGSTLMASAILAPGFTWRVIVRYQTQIRNGFDRRPKLCRGQNRPPDRASLTRMPSLSPALITFRQLSRSWDGRADCARGEIGSTARGTESQLFIAGKIRGWDRRARVCYRNHKAPNRVKLRPTIHLLGIWSPVYTVLVS